MADKSFVPASGTWNTSGNWSPSGVPGNGDNVTIGSGKTCTINTSPAMLGSLTVNGSLSGAAYSIAMTGTLTIGAVASLALSSLNNQGGVTFTGASATVTIGTWANSSTLSLQGASNVITCTGTLTQAGAVSGSYALTCSGGGLFNFQSTINVASVAITGTIWLSNNVTTTTSQTYTGAVTLNGNVTMTTTNNNVTFTSTISGVGRTFSISQGNGTVTFGGTTNVSTLTVSGSGAITLRDVITAGAQSYTGAINLTNGTSLTTTNSNVTFSSTINGAQTLSISQGTGAVSFGGIVGSSTSLSSLTVSGTGLISSLKSVTTTGAQSYGGMVILAANTTLTTTNSNVSFTSYVEGNYTLAISQGSGQVSFGGYVGA